jgi:hypothetical protein
MAVILKLPTHFEQRNAGKKIIARQSRLLHRSARIVRLTAGLHEKVALSAPLGAGRQATWPSLPYKWHPNRTPCNLLPPNADTWDPMRSDTAPGIRFKSPQARRGRRVPVRPPHRAPRGTATLRSPRQFTAPETNVSRRGPPDAHVSLAQAGCTPLERAPGGTSGWRVVFACGPGTVGGRGSGAGEISVVSPLMRNGRR